MTTFAETLWEFNTRRFSVRIEAHEETTPDLSWCDDEDLRRIDCGADVLFAARTVVLLDGVVIAANWLGNCVYAEPRDVVAHYGRDMLGETIAQARAYLADVPPLRAAA